MTRDMREAMHDHRLEADYWNNWLSTGAGEGIVNAIMYYQGNPPRLAPPIHKLRERVGCALQSVGVRPQIIQVLSVSKLEESLLRLKHTVGETMWERLEAVQGQVFERTLKSPLWHDQHTALELGWLHPLGTSEQQQRVKASAFHCLHDTDWFTFSSCFNPKLRLSHVLKRFTQESFEATLCYRLWLTVVCGTRIDGGHGAAEAAERLSRLMPFVELFHEGNFPIARMWDADAATEAFLVLVR